MSLPDRVIALYEWKERLATKRQDLLTNDHLLTLQSFDLWFETITFDRQEPEIMDIMWFEEQFKEMEKCFGGSSSA